VAGLHLLAKADRMTVDVARQRDLAGGPESGFDRHVEAPPLGDDRAHAVEDRVGERRPGREGAQEGEAQQGLHRGLLSRQLRAMISICRRWSESCRDQRWTTSANVALPRSGWRTGRAHCSGVVPWTSST